MTDTTPLTLDDRRWFAHVLAHAVKHKTKAAHAAAILGPETISALGEDWQAWRGALNAGITPACIAAAARFPHAPCARPWLDLLTTRLTAFDSFDALVNARGGYRPSIYPGAWKDMLSWAYDNYQAERGDARRAYPDYPGRLQGWTRATHTIRTPGPWARNGD